MTGIDGFAVSPVITKKGVVVIIVVVGGRVVVFVEDGTVDVEVVVVGVGVVM